MQPRDFYEAYAVAMLTWQSVEAALFEFFWVLFYNPGQKQVGAVFYSQDSFGGKLRIVDKTAQVALSTKQLKKWAKLKEDLDKAAGERNILAHWTAVADFEGNDLHLVLAPALWVPPEIRRKRNKKYDGAECARLKDVFAALAEELRGFARLIPERAT